MAVYIQVTCDRNRNTRGPCSLVHSFGDVPPIGVSVGYKGAMVAGRAVVNDVVDPEGFGRAAKETFRVSGPGRGDCTLRAVGVEGAVTDTRGSVDLGFG